MPITCYARRRSQSALRDKLDLGGGHHLVTKVATEESLRTQVDAATDDLAELILHADHVEEGDRGQGRELHQYVHVALRTEVVAQHGAEEGEALDGIAAAELGDALVLDLEVKAPAALLIGDVFKPAPEYSAGRPRSRAGSCATSQRCSAGVSSEPLSARCLSGGALWPCLPGNAGGRRRRAIVTERMDVRGVMSSGRSPRS